MDLTLLQATPEDAPLVSAILSEAASWQKESGQPMWRPEQLTSEKIEKDITQYFVAHLGDQPIGTLKFQTEDKFVWPDITDHDAAYVHHLAIRRKFAGQGHSSRMLQWAAKRAQSLGKQFLRLDCDTHRPRLRQVYENFGFQHHSDKQWGSIHVTRYAYKIDRI